MAFNTAYLTTTRFGSKGLTAGKEEITLNIPIDYIPSGHWRKEPDDDCPAYVLCFREQFGFHLEPWDMPKDMCGPMHNGVYAQIDNLVRESIAKDYGLKTREVPVLMPVHDRFETWDQYDRNSR